MGSYEITEMNDLKDTELRLGLPGSVVRNNKRSSPETSVEESMCKSNVASDSSSTTSDHDQTSVQPTKVQVVGWPPIRSYRKNNVQQQKKVEQGDGGGMYVKVSMAGAPYLRKLDLNVYNSYPELLMALQNMFKCTFGEYSEREGYNGSEYAPTYEDKDGDWMLVGDVPWNMFMSSCKRLRIVKGSEAKGLACLDDVHYERSFATGENIKLSSKGMRSSKFCLHPAGDTPSSCRLFDASVSHCVPVIVSDQIELPFEDEIDYSQFSVFFSFKEALEPGYMINQLRRFPKSKWTEMWRQLKNISHHYEFQYPPKREDAVNMLWRQIKHKLPGIRRSVHRSRRLKIPDWWKKR